MTTATTFTIATAGATAVLAIAGAYADASMAGLVCLAFAIRAAVRR